MLLGEFVLLWGLDELLVLGTFGEFGVTEEFGVGDDVEFEFAVFPGAPDVDEVLDG